MVDGEHDGEGEGEVGRNLQQVGPLMQSLLHHLVKSPNNHVPTCHSVSDPDPVGSGFNLPCWIRIRIRNPDPESEIEQ